MTEESLAGAILLDGKILNEIQGLVSADDFQNQRCKAVFVAAADLTAAGEIVDPVSISERARRFGVTLSIEWMKDVMDIVPTVANAGPYVHPQRARCS